MKLLSSMAPGPGRAARITAATSRCVELQALVGRAAPRLPAVALSLVQAVPKGGNMEWIVEKAVELGVSAIHPVLTTENRGQGWTARRRRRSRRSGSGSPSRPASSAARTGCPPFIRPPRSTRSWPGCRLMALRIIAAIQDDSAPSQPSSPSNAGRGKLFHPPCFASDRRGTSPMKNTRPPVTTAACP